MSEKKRTLKRLAIDIKELSRLCDELSTSSRSAATENRETTLQEMQFFLQLKHCEKEIGKHSQFDHVEAKNLVGYLEQHPFRFIFFQKLVNKDELALATCVRWPVARHDVTSATEAEPLPAYKLEIHTKESFKARRAGASASLAYDAHDAGEVESGMFIADDGTVVVMRPPAPWSVEVVVPGNPGDAASNYKCLT